jgi:uncharacterized membrane protein (Fun14 family)
MMFLPLDILGDILALISGSIGGLPTIVVMAIPFIVGLIIGFLIRSFLKWAIIAFIIVLVLAYFGVWGLSLNTLQQWSGVAIQGAIIVIGILPLGLGFIIGLILGFIFG